ncbi:hypothetical protein ACH4F6_23970 [Streptomyces sp. NPDC017936]|uniref:hypothetical protein n=1 Tax=Streptomyces sp. NPDC017936 TaxID=3365016 RepID=UPI0037B74D63
MSLRTRIRAVGGTAALTGAALASVGLALAGAAPAAASGTGTTAVAATVPWSASHGTATAAGDRWVANRKLVLDGTLGNTGSDCYSVWTRYVHDWVVLAWTKQAEICGAGSVDFTSTHDYTYTVTGTLKVCRGTTDTTDCGTGVGITYWPIG